MIPLGCREAGPRCVLACSMPGPDDETDDQTGERFLKVVGRRALPASGLPSAARRRALDTLQAGSTRAPKGVHRYASHEAANADRDAWTVQAMVERAAMLARSRR